MCHVMVDSLGNRRFEGNDNQGSIMGQSFFSRYLVLVVAIAWSQLANAQILKDLSSPSCDGLVYDENVVEDSIPPAAHQPFFQLGLPRGNSLSVDCLYTSDVFRNTRGGGRVGGVYGGLVDLVATLDMNATPLKYFGGSLVLHGQNKHGPTLKQFVGASQSTNIDAQAFTAMAEYYYQRDFGSGPTIRIGRQVGAHQFSVLDLAADFTFGGFQKSPNNPVPWYPNPTVGVVAIQPVGESLELSAGSFAASDPTQLTPWGWNRDGHIYNVAQWKYSYSILDLPGDLQNGIWSTSGTQPGIPTGSHSGNHGVYAGWNQLIWNESAAPQEGLGTFLIYSWAPSDRNRITNHFASGLVYRGFLPTRSNDNMGLGISIAEFSQAISNQKSEKTVEFYYASYLSDAVVIQPAVHYTSAPSRIHPDALDFGVRFELAL